MTDRTRALLDEYRERFARGEHPDPRDYLERAGDEAALLREEIDAFLRRAPAPEPSDAAVRVMRAWAEGRPPLLELRAERGVTRDAVVDSLVADLGIAPAKRPKVLEYYHRLEAGLLDPARIDRRVFAAIARALHAGLADLAFAAPPQAAGGPFLRSQPAAPAQMPADAVLSQRAPAERDEVDELFGG
jgi:hypothetical protein